MKCFNYKKVIAPIIMTTLFVCAGESWKARGYIVFASLAGFICAEVRDRDESTQQV